MRRSDEYQLADFERAVEIGEENAECLQLMNRWCQHVEIERISEGLYAQWTGLPIASHSISCPYVQGRLESMNLRWIFSDFLVRHCADCPYHIPNGNPSWGQAIIDEHREQVRDRERAEKDENDRISELRSELRSKSKDISTEANPEFRRIVDYLEAIFSDDETKREEAAERLKQSARLGADLFLDSAIDLVLVLAGSLDFSALMLPVCRELAGNRPDLGCRLGQIALDNIAKKGLHPELSASVLEGLGDGVSYPLDETCIEQLMLSQEHHYDWLTNRNPDYPSSTAVLVRSFDAGPDTILRFIRRELQNQIDEARFRLLGAIKLVQSQRPQIAEPLLDDLIRSLELHGHDQPTGQTPSAQIVQILQSAFRHSTDKVDRFLAEAMARVRPSVQEDIIRAYRNQFLDPGKSWEELRERRKRKEVSKTENIAIRRLLLWIKDDGIEIDIRNMALEALEIACDYAARGVLGEFDSLFGYFAIVAGKEGPPEPPPRIVLPDQPESEVLERLNQSHRHLHWGTFQRRLQSCLEKLCPASPCAIFETISGCLDQPWEHLDKGLRACCVSMLGKLGEDYRIRPRVLPLVWRALMDYESAAVRGSAIRATIDMFPSPAAPPPTNLADIILIHLRDPKVGAHLAALQAVSWRSAWFDENQSIEALNCLSAHLKVYRDNPYRLDEICDGILSVGRRYTRIKQFALRLVESVFPTGEGLVDEKIMRNMITFCKAGERIAPLVARHVGLFLARYERDRYNAYEYSVRFTAYEWLHQLPPPTFQQIADDLVIDALQLAERDAWESCQFASLFARFRAYQHEQTVLETAANALPQEPRYEEFRGDLRQLAMVAARNSSLQAGNPQNTEVFPLGKDTA